MRQPRVEQAAVRLQVIGVGEEEEILELEELVEGGAEAEVQQHQDREVALPEPDPDLHPEADLGGGPDSNRIDLRPFTNAVVPGPLPGPPLA